MSDAFTYQDAGVNIDAGNKLVDKLKNIVKMTNRPGVLGSLGGFGGCFELPSGYRQPVLVSSTDGVGTKLALAIQLKQHDTVGIDLVAMCANDLVVMGAEPLYFLDYFATGKLDVETAATVINGIAMGCVEANMALIGGETAEMPGMYQNEDYDLAGFCVGIIEKENVITGNTIIPGDVLIALPSSGPHANGYSLIRHILKERHIALETPFGTQTLAQALMAPTRIYVKPLLALARAFLMKGAAHITGGGFIENIPRILPKNCAAEINRASWALPPIFEWLQSQGQLSNTELFRTFNCGVGMMVCVAKQNLATAMAQLQAQGETPWVIGEIIPHTGSDERVIFKGEN